ncbi:MAG: Type 1 glutamine amidotransferase-like domain-containing protein [bacterium]|nr:Type 1 glutamine amidotransferase-like domain-containing protein [bacterium]
MILFLASNIGGIKKENGKKYPVKFFEKNNFLNNLKKYLDCTKKFVLISSNPDDYEKNDLFLNIDIEALRLSDLIFDEYVILDRRNANSAESILKDANLIFLSGGNTLIQNKFFNQINLKKYLTNTNSVIVGISAGSINAAKNVFNSPESEDDLNNSPYLQGLELTNINVEPHFDLNNLTNDSKKIQIDSILSESNKRVLYGLTDGAYIIKNNSNCILYGESYKINHGSITKLCGDDNFLVIDDII